MRFLEPDEERRVERHSSIYQHKHMLAVRRGDEWVPIAFDVLDGFGCKETYTHKAVLTDKPYIGYSFPVGECSYASDVYVSSNQQGQRLRALPAWYGAGFYEDNIDRTILINSASGALGNHQETTLRVGLDYCLATMTLPAVD